MAAIFGMQTWLNRRRNSAPAESAKPALDFALAATLLLVTLLNPYGLALHLRVVAAVTNPALARRSNGYRPSRANSSRSGSATPAR